jgi:hypothetical protein
MPPYAYLTNFFRVSAQVKRARQKGSVCPPHMNSYFFSSSSLELSAGIMMCFDYLIKIKTYCLSNIMYHKVTIIKKISEHFFGDLIEILVLVGR